MVHVLSLISERSWCKAAGSSPRNGLKVDPFDSGIESMPFCDRGTEFFLIFPSLYNWKISSTTLNVLLAENLRKRSFFHPAFAPAKSNVANNIKSNNLQLKLINFCNILLFNLFWD